MLGDDEYEKPIVAKLRRNQARTQTWSYYRNVFAGIDFSDKGSGSDTDTETSSVLKCCNCRGDLDDEDIPALSSTKTTRKKKSKSSVAERKECKRCVRHLRIFGVKWPERKSKKARLPNMSPFDTDMVLVLIPLQFKMICIDIIC